jgi:antitoxin ParD1/3/4
METEPRNYPAAFNEDHKARLQTLRVLLNASITAGGHNSDDDLTRMLDAKAAELAKAGY